jgi:hypothetical protein
MATIFLSYRRSDSQDVTGRIYDALAERFSKRAVFKDVDSIPLGNDFRRVLEKAVRGADVVIAVIGPTWARAADAAGRRRLDDPDDFVRLELEQALQLGKPVIPVTVSGAPMVAPADLPPSLQALPFQNGLPVRPDPDFHNDITRLIAALERTCAGLARRAQPAEDAGKLGALVPVILIAVAVLTLAGVVGLGLWGMTRHGNDLARVARDQLADFAQTKASLTAATQRLEAEIASLDADIQERSGKVAQAEVDLEHLRTEVATTRGNLDRRLDDLLVLEKQADDATFTRHWESYKAARAGLDGKEKVLRQKQDQLRAAQDQLAVMKSQHDLLRTRLAELETKQQELRLAGDGAPAAAEAGKLDDVKKALQEIGEQLEAAKRAGELQRQAVEEPAEVKPKPGDGGPREEFRKLLEEKRTGK